MERQAPPNSSHFAVSLLFLFFFLARPNQIHFIINRSLIHVNFYWHILSSFDTRHLGLSGFSILLFPRQAHTPNSLSIMYTCTIEKLNLSHDGVYFTSGIDFLGSSQSVAPGGEGAQIRNRENSIAAQMQSRSLSYPGR